MKISIVIINYNGARCIPACISSCVAEGVEAQDIVVVDNGSDDNSLALVRHGFPDVRIVANACNAGFARAVNQGLREAGQELVLILNNDARLQSGAVAHLIRCAERFPDAALIGARLLDVQQRPQNVVAPFPRVWHDLLPKFLLKRVLRSGPMGRMANVSEPMVVPTLIGAALLLQRSVLPILGLMDEDFFFYLEETEWCQRAHGLGFTVLFCPEAGVEHDLGGTANRYRAAARIEFHRSRLIYAKKVDGLLAQRLLVLILYLSSSINFLVNGVLTLGTLFLSRKLRQKTKMYGILWLWHSLGRPRNWGLPNKCPKEIS